MKNGKERITKQKKHVCVDYRECAIKKEADSVGVLMFRRRE
jgi:hypothetical protein